MKMPRSHTLPISPVRWISLILIALVLGSPLLQAQPAQAVARPVSLTTAPPTQTGLAPAAPKSAPVPVPALTIDQPSSLSFIPNTGQHPSPIAFEALLPDGTALFGPKGIQFELAFVQPAAPTQAEREDRNRTAVAAPVALHQTFHMEFINPPATAIITAGTELAGQVNDYRSSTPARWRTGLPTYASITYRNLYPGIDVSYEGLKGNLKSTYTVAAQADPNDLLWHYTDGVTPAVDAHGNLMLTLPATALAPARVLTETAPIAWQETDDQRVAIAVSYHLFADGRVGFDVGSYDPSLPLIIDPTLTSQNINQYVSLSQDLAQDQEGNLYILGFRGNQMVVVKLSHGTHAPLYQTLFGDTTTEGEIDHVSSIAVDANGYAYVGASKNLPGSTAPTSAQVLTLNANGAIIATDAMDLTPSGAASVVQVAYDQPRTTLVVVWVGIGPQGYEYYLTRKPATGAAVTSALMGYDFARLAVGSDGTAYLAMEPIGTNTSTLLKVTLDGTVSTLTTLAHRAEDIAVDNAQNIYLALDIETGQSIEFQKRSPTGTLIYSIPVNGNSFEGVASLAVDPVTEIVYAAGYTTSTNFPVLGSASAPSGNDFFVLSLDASGLRYSLVTPGNSTDGIVVTADGVVSSLSQHLGNAFLVQVDARPYSVAVTLNTLLGQTEMGISKLVVDSDTGWYTTPYVEYTVEIVNHTDQYQTLDVQVSTSGPRQHLTSPNLTSDSDTHAESEIVGIPAHMAVAIPLGVWVKPSDVTVLGGIIRVAPFQTDPNPLRVDMPEVLVPLAHVRPVVVVPGFVASMPDADKPYGYALDPLSQAYTNLVDELKYMGYDDPSAIVEYAYPWYSKPPLKNTIAELAFYLKDRLTTWWSGKTPPPYIRTDEFDLVSHSTGGLITRYLVGHYPEGDALLHSVFFVGVPQRGTPATYAPWEGLEPASGKFGVDLVLKTLVNTLATKDGCANTYETLRAPSPLQVYQYLHGQPCIEYDYDEDGVVTATRHKTPLGIPLMKELLPISSKPEYWYLQDETNTSFEGQFNIALADLEQKLSATIQNITNDGHIFSVFSTDVSTKQGYRVDADPAVAPLWENGTTVPLGWEPGLPAESLLDLSSFIQNDFGDGTVPSKSSDLATIATSTDVQTIRLQQIEHTKYFNENRSLFPIVARLIKADVADLLALDENTPDDPALAAIERGLLPLRPALDILDAVEALASFINECPVTMLITDPQGRRIGTTPDGTVVNEIPGGFYTGHDPVTGPDYLWFPAIPGQYQVTVTGVDPGDYQISGQVLESAHTTRLGLWTGALAPGEVATYTTEFAPGGTAPTTLVVDDSAGSAPTNLVLDTLTSAGRSADVWSVAQQGLPTVNDLYPYTTVVWTTGNGAGISGGAASSLQAFVALGGNVLLHGDDGDGTSGQAPIFTETVHATIAQPSTDSRALTGVDLLTGLTLQLNGGTSANNQDSPSVLAPFADATPLASYTGGTAAGQPAGLRYATGTGRLVYLGFGLEGLATATQRTEVVDRLLTWLETGSASTTITWEAPTYHGLEASGTIPLTATLSTPSAYTVTVQYVTTNGTALAGSDYTALAGTLTFAPGQLRQIVPVAILNDNLPEATEFFTVSLQTPTNAILGTPAEATVFIDPNDNLSVAPATQTVQENAGTATITINMSPALDHEVTVQYATSNGSATAEQDYTEVSGSVTFNPGQISRTIAVPILEDGALEGPETFSLVLSSPVNAGLGSPAASTITIAANDSLTISPATTTVQENVGSLALTVNLNAPSSQTVSVAYTTSGTASSGSDYPATSGTVIFSPGQTSRPLTIQITDDGLSEPAETLIVTLSGPVNAGLGSPAASTITIAANDSLTISPATTTVQENVGSVALTINLNAPSSQTISVVYATSGTATSGSDYPATSGTVTFSPGQTSKPLTILITNDGLSEPDETIIVTLSGPINAGLGSPASSTITIAANDQATFQAPATLNTGNAPFEIAAGDLNKDGKQDLVVANSQSNSIGVLLGNGAGTFLPQASTTVGSSPFGVAVGDLNRDGILDVVVANDGANTVSILLGTGTGALTLQPSSPAVGANPYDIALGDLNRDGALDIVTANRIGNSVSVLLGNGTGGFSPQTSYVVGINPRGIAIDDLNRDGKLDVVTANQGTQTDSSISVLLGSGTGTLGMAQAVPFGTTDGAFGVATGDLNRDSIPDLVIATSNGNNVKVLFGTGSGTFTLDPANVYAVGTNPLRVAVGDVNGDGFLDVATSNWTGSSVSVLHNTGTGKLLPAASTSTGAQATGVLLADLSQDGRLDIAVASLGSASVKVLLNQTALSTTGALQSASPVAAGAAPASTAVGDLNRDGRPDLVTANTSTANSVSVLLATSTGGYQTALSYATAGTANMVALGDLNRDGILDLIVTDTVAGLGVRLGSGSGTFPTYQTTPTVSSYPGSLAVGDVNRDGKLDVVTANADNTANIFLGNGSGGWTSVTSLAAPNSPRAITLHDLNRDGKLDILVANSTGTGISVAWGNGTGTFGGMVATTAVCASGPQGLAVGDMTGDGAPDVVVACTNEDLIRLVTGSASGTLTLGATSTVGDHPLSIALGDLTRDGLLDVAVANWYGGSVSILRSQATGPLVAVGTSTGGIQTNGVSMADLNRDGKLDVVAAQLGQSILQPLLQP
jgi:hypothetical protein